MTVKSPTSDVSVFELPRGKIYVLTPDGLDAWVPGVEPPFMPYVSAVGFGVNDLEVTKKLLAQNKVAFNAHNYAAIWVEPKYTCGPVVSFIQA